MDRATLETIKAKVKTLPLRPGVYIMLDDKNGVLYVGKAKQLKNRVSQYFQDSANHNEKTRKLVSNIADFDYIVADSEFEALVLECSLIKRHRPHYNILLKDDKGYPFIRVNLKDAFPRFTLVHKTEKDGARYFGPYGGRSTTFQVITAVTEAFKLPDCNRKFPRDIGAGRPCLNYHMERCLAPCAGKLSEEEHRGLILEAVSILEGKFEEVTRQLERDMEEAAEELLFEKAALLRDRKKAIEKLASKQKVVSGALADTDIVGYFSGAKTVVSVLHYIDGALLDRDVELLETPAENDPAEVLDAFLAQYYVGRTTLPKAILLPFHTESEETLARMLSEQVGSKVRFFVPEKGLKRDLVKLSEKNAREEAERLTSKEEQVYRTLTLLQKTLGLDAPPMRIEAYDISNLAGGDIVGSMTVFRNGVKEKKNFRRFRIKGFDAQDDYGSMREVIERRVTRFLDGDEKFSPLPDLMLIDGGEIHAKTALSVLESHGLSIPVFGMVKDGRHRTRGLISPDGLETGLSHNPALFGFIGRIQEETHRFAIEYSRSLRKKRVQGSELDKVPGIGAKSRAKLLKAFKSVRAIREADLPALLGVLPKNGARAVYDYYHAEDSAAKQGGETTEPPQEEGV
ncbi:excinuclease ABC subunit UvrC [Oscillospiraceae bacterium OttesenSCG-928-G22]|nr:excinuclease ABC subunit UvrC [Oscillospiraceae bacterium OttesenSCG-928-G22]